MREDIYIEDGFLIYAVDGEVLRRVAPNDSFVCQYCGKIFKNDDTVQLTDEGHFGQKHPGKKISFALVRD